MNKAEAFYSSPLVRLSLRYSSKTAVACSICKREIRTHECYWITSKATTVLIACRACGDPHARDKKVKIGLDGCICENDETEPRKDCDSPRHRLGAWQLVEYLVHDLEIEQHEYCANRKCKLCPR